MDPQAFSNALGIPILAADSPEVLPLLSFAGARNINSGVAVLALLYTG
jgi:hypothetical protein